MTESRSRALEGGIAVLIFAAVLLMFLPHVKEGVWHGDEPHKISETYFFRLMLAGDVHDRAWFADPIARSNPQVGKAIYGLAIRAAGATLPNDLSIQQELLRSPTFVTSEETRLRNLDRLYATRRVSVIATAAAAVLIFALVARIVGLLGGLFAAALFCRHYVVASMATTAVYDSLMTAFIVGALLAALLSTRARTARGAIACAAVAAVLCAAVFQTRLSGLVAWGACIVCLGMSAAVQRAWRYGLLLIAVVTLLTLLFSIASNPYYWSTGGGIADDQPLPVRVAERMRLQVNDLRSLLHGHSAEIHSRSERFSFEGRVLISGVAGKVMAGMTLVAALFLLFLPRLFADDAKPILLATMAIMLVLAIWLPVRWERYLEPVIAAMAIHAGVVAGTIWNRLRAGEP